MFDFFSTIADFFSSIVEVILLFIRSAWSFFSLSVDIPGFLIALCDYLPAVMVSFALAMVLVLIIKGIFGR